MTLIKKIIKMIGILNLQKLIMLPKHLIDYMPSLKKIIRYFFFIKFQNEIKIWIKWYDTILKKNDIFDKDERKSLKLHHDDCALFI